MNVRSTLFAVLLIAGCHKEARESKASGAPARQEPVLARTAPEAQPPAAATQDSPAPRSAPPPGAQEMPTIPEDPVAAKKASAQWNEHLEHEEEERQMLFDKPRIAKHRAIVRSLKAIRARFDVAKNEAAIEKARDAAGKELEKVDAQVKALDPWGVNSRLLPDYAALRALFAKEYPDARVAAVGGDTAALDGAKAKVEERFHAIAEWLEEAEHGGEEEGEEREREERRERSEGRERGEAR